MPNCLFCKILAGEIPSYSFRENDEFIAFFDAFPNRPGQTLVIPKAHYDSDLFEIDEEGFYDRLMKAGRQTAKLLKKAFNVPRVALVVEGLEVPHLHLRLYPIYPNTYLRVDSGDKATNDELLSWQKLLLEVQ